MKHQQFLKLDRLYYLLSELPELLSISQNELIEQAIQGNLEFIVRVPPNAKVWSVHPDAIDIGSPSHQYKKLTGQAKPVNANETVPVSMESSDIAGLVLSRGDCFRLRSEGVLYSSIFNYAVNSRANWVCGVEPCPRNAFHKKITHDVDGWRLACYPDNTPLNFVEGVGYPKPLEIDVTPENTWVTQRSLDSLLYSISNGNIVDEFFIRNEEGAFVGIKEDALEPISDRLRYVLESLAICWQGYTPDESATEITDRQAAVDNQLKNDEFISLFDEKNEHSGLLNLLSKVTTPVFTIKQSSESAKKTYPSYITPQLVELVIGWKLHWSGSHIDANNPSTLPARGRVKEFMRKRGFPGNDTDAAATLVRPSTAKKGKPVRKKRRMRPVMRKHIQDQM